LSIVEEAGIPKATYLVIHRHLLNTEVVYTVHVVPLQETFLPGVLGRVRVVPLAAAITCSLQGGSQIRPRPSTVIGAEWIVPATDNGTLRKPLA
jgi:hypothetical protein